MARRKASVKSNDSIELTADDFGLRLTRVELPGRGHLFIRDIGGDFVGLIPQFTEEEKKDTSVAARKWLPLLAKVICNSKGEELFDEQTIHRLMDNATVLMAIINCVTSQLNLEVTAAKNGSTVVIMPPRGYATTLPSEAGSESGSSSLN